MSNRSNLMLEILVCFWFISLNSYGFEHKPFLVERFKRYNDDNALVYPSIGIQYCLGLFLQFCKTRDSCLGFSVSKDNRLCKLSDYVEGLSLTDDDAYDSYQKISDSVLDSPAGNAGISVANYEIIKPESRKTTTTAPRSRSRNYCSDSYPYSFSGGSQCCNTKRTTDNGNMWRSSANCRNDRQTSCSSCYSNAKFWNKVPDEAYVVPYS